MAATLTAYGRSSLVQLITGSILPIPYYIAWGTGSGTSSATDQALFAEVIVDGRTSGSYSQQTTVTTGDTLKVSGTLTATNSEIITNVGLFTNNISPYETILQAPVTSTTQTAITVVSPGLGSLPTIPFNIQILSEVMTVTGITGNVWTVTRGVNQSTKLSSIPSTTIFNTVSGSLFAKADFTGLSLNSGDKINFNINIEFI
jgi:membrane-associated protease RseP (regulator of RpoE activity)